MPGVSWRVVRQRVTRWAARFVVVELGDPSFHATVEAYAGAPIVSDNDVRLLLNGDRIFPALIEAIRSARTSITYAQYFFEEGPVADDVVAALAERCRAGVRTHVLLDGVGTVSMPARHIQALKAARCDVRTFRALRPWALRRANNRNHRRILVVDGRVGITGGSGVSRKWMGNGLTADHWRDTDVRLEGPAGDLRTATEGGCEDLRIPPGASSRQDRGDRRDVGHGGQYESG